MILKTASVERQEMLDLAKLSMESANRDGRPFEAHMEARRLLALHPECRTSFEELRDGIARLANTPAAEAWPWSLGP